MLNIVNIIPFGKDNAISRTALCHITGLSDRAVRDAIADARNEHVILSVRDGKGYFRPTEEEKKDVEIWLKIEASRANSINKAMETARKMVKGG